MMIAMIDNSNFFFNIGHNGYELERIFGLKPKLLSDCFSPDVWNEIIRLTRREGIISLVDLLKENNIVANIRVLSEGAQYTEDTKKFVRPYTGPYMSLPYNTYTDRIQNIHGNIYYYGYWINVHWFQYIRDIIIKEFTFPPAADDFNKRMIEQITNSLSVGVHVRRGDFVSLGWALDLNYYKQSVSAMKSYLRDPKFFIFSDDMQFCNEHLEELGFDRVKDKIVFVDGNGGLNNFRDMHLMSLCKNLLIANSSFSYLAALLNQNPGKYVLNPTKREII
jgi:hypothetical protein